MESPVVLRENPVAHVQREIPCCACSERKSVWCMVQAKVPVAHAQSESPFAHGLRERERVEF